MFQSGSQPTQYKYHWDIVAHEKWLSTLSPQPPSAPPTLAAHIISFAGARGARIGPLAGGGGTTSWVYPSKMGLTQGTPIEGLLEECDLMKSLVSSVGDGQSFLSVRLPHRTSLARHPPRDRGGLHSPPHRLRGHRRRPRRRDPPTASLTQPSPPGLYGKVLKPDDGGGGRWGRGGGAKSALPKIMQKGAIQPVAGLNNHPDRGCPFLPLEFGSCGKEGRGRRSVRDPPPLEEGVLGSPPDPSHSPRSTAKPF